MFFVVFLSSWPNDITSGVKSALFQVYFVIQQVHCVEMARGSNSFSISLLDVKATLFAIWLLNEEHSREKNQQQKQRY